MNHVYFCWYWDCPEILTFVFDASSVDEKNRLVPKKGDESVQRFYSRISKAQWRARWIKNAVFNSLSGMPNVEKRQLYRWSLHSILVHFVPVNCASKNKQSWLVGLFGGIRVSRKGQTFSSNANMFPTAKGVAHVLYTAGIVQNCLRRFESSGFFCFRLLQSDQPIRSKVAV